jgi:hypothetical protein
MDEAIEELSEWLMSYKNLGWRWDLYGRLGHSW